MILLFSIILSLYVFGIALIIVGNISYPSFRQKVPLEAETTFTVVIPFRNEQNNLHSLLASLRRLNYDPTLLEIILVNDESTDQSVPTIRSYIKKYSLNHFKLINNQRKTASPKKDAITTAISKSAHQWIVTTDADCEVSQNWLSRLDLFIRSKNPKMVAGPVGLKTPRIPSLLFAYQLLEFMSLQATTKGMIRLGLPFLANGANLAYEKSAFEAVNGYRGNSYIASGDDIFLLQKFDALFPKKIAYFNSRQGIVHTVPVQTWSQFLEQRKRWVSKTRAYKTLIPKMIGILVLLANSCLIITAFWVVATLPNFPIATAAPLLICVVAKLIADFVLISLGLGFFKQLKYLFAYPSIALLQPFVSLHITISSFLQSYEWKGRAFKQ